MQFFNQNVLNFSDCFLRKIYLNSTVTSILVSFLGFFLFRYLQNNYLSNTNVEANLYVFLTDYSKEVGRRGAAPLGVVLCDSNKQNRMSLSAYIHSDMFTAKVRNFSDYFNAMNLNRGPPIRCKLFEVLSPSIWGSKDAKTQLTY